MKEPKFDRAIRTRPLDEFDYEILKDGIATIDEHGNEYVPSMKELNATGTSRVTETRDIHTGKWSSENHTGLPFYVTKVKR